MNSVQTLDERKRARVESIRAGFAQLQKELAEFGRTRNGKFLIYGSAVTGRFHFESDIDILVDFDEAHMSEALDFVERTCTRLGLKADVQPKAWCTPAFIERISSQMLVLP